MESNTPKKAIIIGAGIGGLALAIRLKNLGLDVEVYEQNSNPGGKASEIVIEGFRFDTGPSLITMPELLEELFALCNEDIKDYFNISKLTINSRNFFEDGTVINLYSNKSDLLKEIETKTSQNIESFNKYLKFANRVNKTLSDIYLKHSPYEVREIANIQSLIALIKSISFKPFSSLYSSIKKFVNDPHLAQIINRFATYNGSNPFKASAILNTISDLEINKGGYYAKDGVYAIPKSLHKLAEKIGVKFFFNSKVDSILTASNRVLGVKINGVEKFADIVISNIDYGVTHKNLLKNFKEYNNYANKDLSTSVIVFLAKAHQEFPELDIHNLFFSNDYSEEFRQIQNNQLPEDPTVYVNVSSKYNQKHAPKNSENWFILVNTPNLKKFEVEENTTNLLQNIVLEKISRILKKDIKNNIEVVKTLTPKDFEANTSSLFGSLYGPSSNKLLDLTFRPKNKSSLYKNLYFVGGTSHPGGGIPLVLCSAEITSNLIKKYELS